MSSGVPEEVAEVVRGNNEDPLDPSVDEKEVQPTFEEGRGGSM